MGIKNFKPTSPARRFYSVSDFKEITKDAKPLRALVEHQTRTGGRNHYGRITSRFRGGGHKQRYRIIDWKRDKIGVPAIGRDDRVRPEPHGAHRAPPLRRRREALHPRARRPEGRRQDRLEPQRRHQARQLDDAPAHPARARWCTTSSSRRARAVSSSAPPAPPRRSWRRTATTRRSGCPRARSAWSTSSATRPSARCRTPTTRTSRSARRGARAGSDERPHNRGVTMNPVDHPMGGGEGRTSGGRHPCSPWGQLSKGLKTRNNKRTDGMIVKRRGAEGLRRIRADGVVRSRRALSSTVTSPRRSQRRRRRRARRSSRPGRAEARSRRTRSA